MTGKKALFLDRDGTLILDKHHLHDPAGVELIDGVAEALRAALDKGYLLYLFTNQSGIGRGWYTLEQVEACNQRMLDLMGLPASVFTDTCIAPEKPDEEAVYRKPSPRFIVEMAAQYNLDIQASWMVGDKVSDWESGIRANARAVAVETGKPLAGEAADFIEAHTIPTYPTFCDFVDSL